MKKTSATLGAAGIMAACAFGQGQLLFQNVNSTGLSAYGYEGDGVTKLSGNAFQAALIDVDHGSAILAQTGFLSGAGAGVFAGGVVTVPGTPAGSVAHLQVGIWSTAFGSTFAQAVASGPLGWAESGILPITVTGPPSPPATLTGLPSLIIGVPEPSTLALAGLGMMGLLGFRRRS